MFFLLALLIVIAVAGLVMLPVLNHPSLPKRAKRIIGGLMLLIILCGVGIYLLAGIPQLAVL